MRILAFLFHFPPMSGGGSVVSFEIVSTLATLGHEVTVLTPDLEWSGKRYSPTSVPNLNVIRVNTPHRSNLKVAARRCSSNLRKAGEKLCNEKQFDLIFTIFHPFHLVPNAAVSCARKTGVPVIIKIDDAVFAKSSGLKVFQRMIEKRISKKSLKGATEVFVLNEQMKELVSKFYGIPNEKISILPNGLNILPFRKEKNSREKKVVFSGVMYYHRGLDALLKAAPKIIKRIPDMKFILIGEGPEMQKLQKMVEEKGILSNVEFKGWIDRNDIPNHLSSASIGIGPLQLTPLTIRSIPIKALEYMASSLPIIARKDTLSEDVLVNGTNGYFVDSIDDLAEKIILLLEDPSLVKKMGSESFGMVQKFSWENLIKPILVKYSKS